MYRESDRALVLSLQFEGIDYICGNLQECRAQLDSWMWSESDPERLVCFKQQIESLGNEARQVAMLILGTPDEIIMLLLADAGSTRRRFKRYVKEYFDWPWWLVHKTFREIRKIF